MLVSSDFSAIVIGRLVPVKRFDLAIEAWQAIPCPLNIVGEGPERTKLQTLIDKLNLADRVTLVGEVQDVRSQLEQADVLISLSDREGFGYVILEALQAGLFVVSTNTGIATELVPQDYLMRHPSSLEIRERVLKIKNSEDLARECFEPCWHQAKQYTVDSMVRETLSVYYDVLGAGIKQQS